MARFNSAALRTLEFLDRVRRETVGLTNLPVICGPRTVKELEGRGYIKVTIELTDRGRRELKERAAREAWGKASDAIIPHPRPVAPVEGGLRAAD